MDTHSTPGTFQENILALALERMAAGESPAAILAEAGADAEWLEPLLSLASAVHELREVTPVPPAEASLSRFLAQAERMRSAPGPRPAPRRWWEGWGGRLQLPSLAVPRLAAALASVVLAIFALALGTALFLGSPATASAQNVLPGQWSYPLKRLGEEIYLRLPQSSQSRSATSAEYDGRRRDEVRALLRGRLAACVTFRGEVEALDVAEAVVDGIALQLVDETRIEGPLVVGAQAWVEACSQPDGLLVAEHIVVEQPAQPTATPSPTATAQPTFTATATPQPPPSATPTSSPMPTPAPTEVATEAAVPEPTKAPTSEPTELPTETPTREPEASATPTPAPTQETPELPDEGGNENGNGNDDGGDNSNDGDDNSNDGGDNSNDGGDNTNDGGDNSNDGSGDTHGNSGDNDNSGGDDNANASDSDENASQTSGSGGADHS